jgi:hypothetical protein
MAGTIVAKKKKKKTGKVLKPSHNVEHRFHGSGLLKEDYEER